MPSIQRTSPLAEMDDAAMSRMAAREIQRDRRLRVLLILEHAPGRTSNESVLKSALGSLGHVVTTDLLRTELCWLQEQGLIAVSQTEDDLYLARLLSRGQDVASGAAQQPGVASPRPE